MKRVLILTILILLIFTSTSVFADPAGKGTYNWKGFYAGAQGMYAHGYTNWDYIFYNTQADHTTNGWLGGLFAGYNYQFPINIVLGVETDINYGKVSGSTSAPNPVWLATSEINWVGATRIRLGYAVWRFLPYIAAGVSYGRANISERQLVSGLEYSSSDTYVGITHSSGLEFAITNNLMARAEYSYYGFGKKRVQLYPSDDSDININLRGIKFGLSWKF
jgi:outer membrane immunogenic protein